MSLPMEIYPIAMEITHLLDLTEFNLAGDLKWQKTGGNPASKIMALIIIASKLSYDLENSTEWKDWAEATSEELRKINQLNMDDVGQDDILTMSDEKLDEYMDWLQETWIEDDQDPGVFNGIHLLFNIDVSETTYPRVHSSDVSLGEDTDVRSPGGPEDDR
jgi:RNA polymerase I-specific transcription initiation factor RRN7